MSASSDKETYAENEAIQVTVHLAVGSSPVTNASAQVYFIDFSGSSAISTCPLAEKGNGDYEGFCMPSNPGIYTIEAVAKGTYSSNDFERAVYIPKIIVTPSALTFGNISSEFTSDTNDNRLYDYLTLQPAIQVHKDSQYTFIATLTDTTGTVVANAVTSLQLAAGNKMISLVFDGRTIRKSGKDGPYKLAQVITYDLKQNGLFVDKETDIYTTATYHSFDFEGPPLNLGTGSDYGVDANGDGIFDALTIELNVSISQGYNGNYAFNAQLQGQNGTGIDWFSNQDQYLTAGTNILQLTYAGTSISSSGLNGPYQLANFSLYNVDNPEFMLSSPIAYMTKNYLLCQFQGAPPCLHTLAVTISGNGIVTSDPAGINCGSDCTKSYNPGTQITLTAIPQAGSTFDGWVGGGCSGTGSCIVTLNSDETVTATFTLQRYLLTVTKSGTGNGTVISSPAGINCGSDCAESYDSGTVVILTATPDSGSNFENWTGCDSTNGNQCTATLNSDKTVSATFTLSQYTLNISKTGTGNGVLTSSPTGIDCGNDCSESYNSGTQVTLTATPQAGSTFDGWSGGGCSGTGTCVVTLSSDVVTVTATFTSHQHLLTVTKTGTGNGTVTSSPKGINCGNDCIETYEKVKKPKKVTLKVKPDAYSTFLGWGGDCQSSGTKTSCKLTMDSDKNVIANCGLPDIAVSPDSYDFGDVKVKQTSAPATFTIKNNGTGNLKISKIEITATNKTDKNMFKIKGGSKKTIPSGGTFQFTVTFKPTSVESKSATLRITSNDPDRATIEIPLSGAGL